jgi:RNA polymerase sigma factor (sigma-70 family)
MTEYQLITQCRSGDRRAQRLLYERYSKAMYTVAYRLTANFDDASEVLQDAFLQVFRHIGDFEQRSTLGAWIKAIVVRCAIGHLRRRRFEWVSLDTDAAAASVDWGTSPLDVEYLERAIQSLPEGARSVFVLAEVEGYGHREIAEILQVSEGTSKSQLHYAKTKLRTLLRMSKWA